MKVRVPGKPRRSLGILIACLILSCGPYAFAPDRSGKDVRFEIQALHAKQVAIIGSFNRWEPRPLSGPDEKGVWSVSLPLPRGRYEYLFLIDGKAVLDPKALSVDDGFGGANSVVSVEY